MTEAMYGSFKNFIFKAAVEFLKGRKTLAKEEYYRLDDEARAKAFTVSGYTSLTILQEFSDQLTKAVEEGESKEGFAKKMNGILADMGYDPLKPYRSDVIFRTNVQTAYNAGHFKSMTDPDTLHLRPYWMYKTAYDGNVRMEHAAMHGVVYRADDPIWDIWYPPNGFRCRCTVVSLTKQDVERRGITVDEDPPMTLDKETGELKMVMPDKGFAQNPAKETYKPDMSGIDKPLQEIFKERQKAKPQNRF